MRTVMLLLVIFALASCQHKTSTPKDKQEENQHWTYEGETGPEHWAEIEKKSSCNGNFQSPINLVNYKVNETLPPLNLHYAKETILHDVVNNGHSIQYDFEAGDFLLWEKDTFQLTQFHFHEPAEHLIDGVRYPLEIHLVHQNQSKEFLVLSVMAKEGQNSEPFAFLESYLPIAKGETKLINKPFDIASNLPKDKNYFHYRGSLTTPPCTEIVEWFVFQQPITVSLNQVTQLKYMMPLNNYRNEQALHGREISVSSF